MEIWNRAERNSILNELEKQGYPFSDYSLKRENGFPIEIGKGSFAFIYAVQKKGKPDTEYALKVIGFNGQNYDKNGFGENINHVKGFVTFHIIHIYKFIELNIGFDDSDQITSIKAGNVSNNTETKSLRLQFILMEKLVPIKQYRKNGRSFFVPDALNNGNEKEVLSLAFDIALALRDIHKKGMIHRDIKPENIFYHESMKKYCLGDFGMSKVTETGLAETTIYTNGYAAPEVLKINGEEEYDSLIDEYSLGMVLYVLMNKMRFPFSDESSPCIEKQYSRDTEFPAPSKASEAFSKIILKMTAYDPDDRYQSMDEVIHELRKLIFHKPMGAAINNRSYFAFAGFIMLTVAAVFLCYSAPKDISVEPVWVRLFETVCQSTIIKILLVIFIVDFFISIIQKNADTFISLFIYIFDAFLIFSTGFSIWKLIFLLLLFSSEWMIKAVPFFLTMLITVTYLSSEIANPGLFSVTVNQNFAIFFIVMAFAVFLIFSAFERLSSVNRKY